MILYVFINIYVLLILPAQRRLAVLIIATNISFWYRKMCSCFALDYSYLLLFSDERGAIFTKPLVNKAEVQLTSFTQLCIYIYMHIVYIFMNLYELCTLPTSTPPKSGWLTASQRSWPEWILKWDAVPRKLTMLTIPSLSLKTLTILTISCLSKTIQPWPTPWSKLSGAGRLAHGRGVWAPGGDDDEAGE